MPAGHILESRQGINTTDRIFMDQKPWYQKRKVAPSFPFLFKDNTFHDFAFHWHELLEIVYIMQGNIQIIVEGSAHHAAKSDIVIINSGAIHGFLKADPGTVVATYQFGLELFDQTLLDLWERTYQKLVFSKKTFVTSHCDGVIHQQLENLLLSIRSEHYAQNEGFRLAIRASLYELALIFLREIPTREPQPGELIKRNSNHKILERVFSFIYDNLNDPHITLEQAAEAAALSKFYFTRFFKQQTGQTFHTYLSRLRVNRAEEYLAETNLLTCPYHDKRNRLAYHFGGTGFLY